MRTANSSILLTWFYIVYPICLKENIRKVHNWLAATIARNNLFFSSIYNSKCNQTLLVLTFICQYITFTRL